MVKRELNEKEKNVTQKNMYAQEVELEYVEKVEIPRKQMAIDTVDIVVKKQMADLEAEKRILVHKAEQLKMILEISKKQLEEGVEIKEPVEEVEETETNE